jgi:hypothetical protein
VRLPLKPDLPDRRDLAALGRYAAAAAAYIAIGVAWIDFLFSFWVGVGYLLLTTWLLPRAFRRLR